ncbi:MAG: flavin reductase [Chloroflexi bacterium]|nr:MAG: flavin reductase [Chloroflexota bacterium]
MPCRGPTYRRSFFSTGGALGENISLRSYICFKLCTCRPAIYRGASAAKEGCHMEQRPAIDTQLFRKTLGRFATSDDQEGLSRHFGGRPMDGLEIAFIMEKGVPLLKGAIAHIVARVVDVRQAGDHTLFLGEVEYLHVGHSSPLLFYAGSYGQMTNQHPAEILGWMGL